MGTGDAVDRVPVSQPMADFAVRTGRDTQAELERQATDGTPPQLTHLVDFRKRMGVEFQVLDPRGLLG